jgi:RNA polymerase sigma-70 factor (ECF subfamily)
MLTPEDSRLLDTARTGDRPAFEALVAPHERALRSYLHRMTGSSDDADDLVQDTLLKAYEQLSAFRGDASFKTWLFRIASNTAIDHLRARKRWTEDAQDRAKAAAIADPNFVTNARQAAAAGPDGVYDMREHVSFCFTCVAKTLPPDQQAALLLRDVYDVSNEDGADAVGRSVAAFKHLVHDGRRTMQTIFEGRCALVSKTGACWQCKELAGFFRGEEERDRQAATLSLGQGADYKARLHIVREHDATTGVGRDLHAFLARQLRRANGYD